MNDYDVSRVRTIVRFSIQKHSQMAYVTPIPVMCGSVGVAYFLLQTLSGRTMEMLDYYCSVGLVCICD